MSYLTPKTLAELRWLLVDSNVASPGPWRRIGERVDDRDRFEVGTFICEQDAALIVAAVNALPVLLDAAEMLATVRDQITRGALCPMCSTGLARWTIGLVCQLCGTDYSRPDATPETGCES